MTTATASHGVTLEMHHLLSLLLPPGHHKLAAAVRQPEAFLLVTMSYSFHRPNFNDDSFYRLNSI